MEVEELKQEIRNLPQDKLPKHIGLIPDGNRRWARKHKLAIKMGHITGYETIKKILFDFFDVGIHYLTIYALSLENAKKRSKKELEQIYKILMKAVETVKEEPKVVEEKVKFNVLGRVELLPSKVKAKVDELLEFTKDHDQNFINLLIMYDGQAEIVDAVKKILCNSADASCVDTAYIKEHLYTAEYPEVDYVIRTGMEDGARLSGFLLWDCSYAEFKFHNTYWPDYSEKMLVDDIKEYVERNRRKGK
ncbi:MAG: Tritrans,polycis-undecaprenyl-diphosphate synthase (geranylgeranyl-diphosphate specific) [Promethearchaeota archaeon]|nr:MAG: Tritrans,polycis-undecaprenyl-diphosphate synthase (geranylgeranyl-diphosphate specific) [Candidatus Lokiarchaeota archaeon]